MKGKPVIYLGSGQAGENKVAAYREQIVNGKRLKQLQREMTRVIEQIERITALSVKLGI